MESNTPVILNCGTTDEVENIVPQIQTSSVEVCKVERKVSGPKHAATRASNRIRARLASKSINPSPHRSKMVGKVLTLKKPFDVRNSLKNVTSRFSPQKPFTVKMEGSLKRSQENESPERPIKRIKANEAPCGNPPTPQSSPNKPLTIRSPPPSPVRSPARSPIHTGCLFSTGSFFSNSTSIKSASSTTTLEVKAPLAVEAAPSIFLAPEVPLEAQPLTEAMQIDDSEPTKAFAISLPTESVPSTLPISSLQSGTSPNEPLTPNKTFLAPPTTPFAISPSNVRKVYIGSARPLSSVFGDQSNVPRLAVVSATPQPAIYRASPLGKAPTVPDPDHLCVPEEGDDLVALEPLAPPPLLPLLMSAANAAKSEPNDTEMISETSPENSFESSSGSETSTLGMSTEQAAQLTKFQDMLTKMKPARRLSDIGPRPLPPPVVTSSSNEAVPRRQSTGSSPLPAKSNTTAKESSTSKPEKRRALPLKGQVIFVDVRTAEGEEAGGVFVDMLRMMGARVTTRPAGNLHYIVYKSGRSTTLQRYQNHAEPKPHVVGIGWVVKCKEEWTKADEKPFVVKVVPQVITKKRRRSMEPRTLGALNLSVTNGDAPIPAADLGLERAKRKAIAYQPRIGSPLARRSVTCPLPGKSSDPPSES